MKGAGVDAPTSTGGGRIELESLSKYYGTQRVLNSIDLTIEAGEFFSLLGPSGCGKTTTLRLIGGFEDIEHGSVRIDGVEMAPIPPEKRPVNTVFQSYALFPHQTVTQNVAFGLRFTDCSKTERDRRVGEALELVRLTGFEQRRPHQLSGGQQQRVALARSLVLRPKVLLLDEPLGALDAKLRRTLQVELRALHREVGITFVYVTHDQEEALTMSDRLAVMRGGEIDQVGTPIEVYNTPHTTFVADFLGIANLLPVTVTAGGDVLLDGHMIQADNASRPGDATIVIRPERIRLVPPGSGQLAATVEQLVFAGPVTHVHLRVGTHPVSAVITNAGDQPHLTAGQSIDVALADDAVRVLGA